MDLNFNTSTSGVKTDNFNFYGTGVAASNAKVEEKYQELKDAVYEKSEKSALDSKAPYSINKMSKEDRASLVQQLKDDQSAREQSLVDLVNKMMNKQAGTAKIAGLDLSNFVSGKGEVPDEVWKMFADGNFTVDEAAQKKAQEDISEDGYWGVKQTSQRLFDFASALAGDDEGTMRKMQDAMLKGFKEATKSWGKELPEISGQTLDAANKLFDDYYKSKMA